MAETIQFDLDVTGEDQVSRALANIEERLRKVEKAERDAGRAVEDTNKKLDSTGTSAQGSGVKLSQFGSTLGQTAQTVAGFNTGAGQMIGVLAQSTGTIQSMSAALGPMGVLLGAASAAFALLTTTAANAKASIEATANASRVAADGFLAMVDAARSAATEYQRMQSILSGAGSPGERQSALEAAQRRLDVIDAQQANLLSRVRISDTGYGELMAERSRLQNQIARLRSAGDTGGEAIGPDGLPIAMGRGPTGRQAEGIRYLGMDRENRGLMRGAEARRRRRRGGRQRPAGGDRNFTWDSFYSARTGGDDAPLPEFIDDLPGNVDRQRAERERRGTAERRQGAASDAANALVANAGSAAAEFRDAWTSSVDDVIEAWGRANTAQQGLAREHVTTTDLMIESAKAVGSTVVDYIGEQATGALRQSVAAWLDGSKSFGEAAEMMAKSIVQSLVAESIVQAAVETARGVAALASVVTAPLAPGHFAAAATWAGVGVAAGAVGLAAGAFGSPAGGGAPSAGAGQRPAADMPSGSAGGGGNTYVINLPSGVVLGDRASAGRMLREAIRESEQRYG